MTTIIMNIGRVPLQVGVIKQVGGKPVSTSVRVPGRGRTPMPTNSTIDTNWMALYGKNIKLVDSSTVQAPVKAPAKTSKSNVAVRMAAQKSTVAPTVAKVTTTAPTVATPAKT